MSWLTGKYALAVVFLLFLIPVVTGFIGVDYGKHWDEFYVSQGLENSVRNLTFIPSTYFYSGMYFNMGYLALGGDFTELMGTSFSEVRKSPQFVFKLSDHPRIMEAQKKLQRKLWSTEFKLRLRRMYVVFSALSVFVLYFAIRGWRSGYLEPLAGAGLMALSWDVGYHARHIAVDNMMMVFGALVLLCIIRYAKEDQQKSRLRWIVLGSIAAGMAAGSKIVGMLLVVPVLISVIVFRGECSMKAALARMALVPLVAFGTLFVVSPGLLLDPVRVINSYALGSSHYGEGFGTWYSYYARPYLGQVPLIFRYFVESVFSPYRTVSMVFGIFSLVGLTAMYREDRKFFLVFLSFPVIYLAIFAGMKLMIVRNFLVVLPFFAVAVSRGVGETYRRFGGLRYTRYVMVGFLLCWAVLNTAFMFNAAASVRPYSSGEMIDRFSKYLKKNPERAYYLSPGIVSEMIKAGHGDLTLKATANAGKSKDALCALFLAEYPAERWQANRSGFFEHVIGSHEVNFDYYPTWVGHNYSVRIYVLTHEKAKKIGYRCGPS
jgi:hypothetical protein